jgi:biotin carboxyl carrier protein
MNGRKRDCHVEIDGEALRVVVERKGDLFVTGSGDDTGELHSVRVLRAGENPLVLVGGRVVALTLGPGEPRGYAFRGHHGEARVAPAGRAAAGRNALGGSGNVLAPMPGRVVALRVREGDAVSAGAPMVVIEAMKMQNELVSPRDGSVLRVLVREGDAVERGATLVELA